MEGGGAPIPLPPDRGSPLGASFGLGSVVNLTDSSGATQRTYSHDPFGSVYSFSAATGAPTVLNRFTGQYFDPTPNLYNLGARRL